MASAPATSPQGRSRKACLFFASSGGCHKGDACTFSHSSGGDAVKATGDPRRLQPEEPASSSTTAGARSLAPPTSYSSSFVAPDQSPSSHVKVAMLLIGNELEGVGNPAAAVRWLLDEGFEFASYRSGTRDNSHKTHGHLGAASSHVLVHTTRDGHPTLRAKIADAKAQLDADQHLRGLTYLDGCDVCSPPAHASGYPGPCARSPEEHQQLQDTGALITALLRLRLG